MTNPVPPTTAHTANIGPMIPLRWSWPAARRTSSHHASSFLSTIRPVNRPAMHSANAATIARKMRSSAVAADARGDPQRAGRDRSPEQEVDHGHPRRDQQRERIVDVLAPRRAALRVPR